MSRDLRARLDPLRQRVAAWAESPRGRLVRRVGRALFLVGVVSYLLLRFAEIGWAEIVRSLPADPRFYAIFLVLYFTLPLTESVIYRLAWGTRFWQNLPVFVKKRIYNKDLLGYSGEAYLFAWGRRHTGLPARRVFGIIRDNVVLSGAGSTAFAVVLLAVFLIVGNLEPLGISRQSGGLYLIAGLAILGGAAAVGARFRHRLFVLSGRMLALLFVLHFGRLAVMNVLQVVQWDLIIPGVGVPSWFVFLAVQVMISRLPILPARDLLFLGASVELAGVLGIPRAEMAAMLVVLSALDKALNLVLFLAVSALDARRPDPLLAEATRSGPAEAE
jgi:hypothetical protein